VDLSAAPPAVHAGEALFLNTIYPTPSLRSVIVRMTGLLPPSTGLQV
jgi:hypothetical protein